MFFVDKMYSKGVNRKFQKSCGSLRRSLDTVGKKVAWMKSKGLGEVLCVCVFLGECLGYRSLFSYNRGIKMRDS